MRRSLCVFLGSLCGGALFATAEVAWLAAQTHLPVEALKVPSFQPPRQIGNILRRRFGDRFRWRGDVDLG